MEFSFLHAADLHLDSPLSGLGTDAPSSQIRGATRQALANLVQLALRERVQFVLLAGDLYDGDWKDWRTGQYLVEQLASLKRANIPVYAISGNHDAEQVLTKQLPFPGELLPPRKPATRIVPGLPVAIHGQSFATRAVTENLALGYPPALAGHFNIGLLHTACGSTEHDNYAPCTAEDLAAKDYDYWALGHVHTRRVVATAPWIVFPGNLQGRNVREEGSKGATLVHVSAGRVAQALHQPLDVLRWARLTVDCTGAADAEEVQNRVAVSLSPAVMEAEGRLLAVRLTLTGPCAAHAALAADPEATRQTMRAAAANVAERDQLWLEDVRVGTRPALDIAALRQQGGAVGALLTEMERPVTLPGDLQAAMADMVKSFGEGLDPDHPARAVANGTMPADLVDRARALLLAELARS